MISLKKYLDMAFDPTKPSHSKHIQLLDAAMTSYRGALQDMGKSSYRACPTLGLGLQQSLEVVEKKLAAEVRVGLLQETRREVSGQLSLWGERTAEHFKEKAEEVKDLLLALHEPQNRWASATSVMPIGCSNFQLTCARSPTWRTSRSCAHLCCKRPASSRAASTRWS